VPAADSTGAGARSRTRSTRDGTVLTGWRADLNSCSGRYIRGEASAADGGPERDPAARSMTDIRIGPDGWIVAELRDRNAPG